jgi:hypothetical protein
MVVQTMGLRFGVFDEFKGATTLLLWGDDALPALRDLFRDLDAGKSRSVRLESLQWALPQGNCAVRITKVRDAAERVRVRRTSQRTKVELDLTRDELKRFADLIEPLIAGAIGHQYLDLDTPEQQLQIIVSKGEYPPDLKPIEAAVADSAK